jgi:hypothetical protein
VISAQSNNKVALSSNNGTSWSSSNLATTTNQSWLTLAYGNGVVLTAAYNTSLINYSTDNGVNWSEFDITAYIPVGASREWIGCTYDNINNIFLMTSYSTSTVMRIKFLNNSISYIDAVSLPANTNWSNIAYGNGRLLAVAGNGITNVYATSDNGGVTWTQRALPVSKDWRTLEYLNNQFVLIEYSNPSISPTILISADGISWSTYSGIVGQGNTKSLAYANGIYMSMGGAGSGKSTNNGASWSSVTLPGSFFAGGLVLSKNNVFIAVGVSQSSCYTSSDTVTWTLRTLPFSGSWFDSI